MIRETYFQEQDEADSFDHYEGPDRRGPTDAEPERNADQIAEVRRMRSQKWQEQQESVAEVAESGVAEVAESAAELEVGRSEA